MTRGLLNIGGTPVDPTEIKELIESGRLALDAVDADGKTALHSVIDFGAEDSVRALVEAGADVNALDRWGNSPLWRAVYHAPNTAAIIVLLLKHGADPTAKNHHDVSPLDLARRLADDHDEIAELLPKLETAAGTFVGDAET